MLAIIALLMICTFVYFLLSQKLTVVGSLLIIPLVFGVGIALFTNSGLDAIFKWIYEGIFYSIDEVSGEIVSGVAPAVFLILFAIFYFNMMLDVGLFDPIIEFFIKEMRGDPLRVTILTVCSSIAVSSTGDTTTAVIILLAAFVDLYKQMEMRLPILALLIIGPNTILNMLPWGGPAAVISSALNIELMDLSFALFPGMAGGILYTICLAFYFGYKERQRLNFDKEAELDEDQKEKMLASIRNRRVDYKRPHLYWVNLLLTFTIIGLLILGYGHGSVLLLLGSIIGATINFGDSKVVMDRIREYVASAIAPPMATLGAGAFSGILYGSGMSQALAFGVVKAIPRFLGQHMALVYTLITIPGLVFLPQEAYYFGISSVMVNVMEQFGVTPLQTGVASMIPQAFGMISPIIPALYILTAQTQQTFFEYQKRYIKYLWPIFAIFCIIYILTGSLPV
ncbi:CitMHS family transporter [Aerococcus urinae]|uniref:CitMHS family transporter n=1 Tax=Aerococcus urinae TaxID=1376 RepID=UPI0018A78572|nr:SLC13 family permease [Aerococcus urinae]